MRSRIAMSRIAVHSRCSIEENILFGTSPGSTHAEKLNDVIDAANLSSCRRAFPRAS